MQYAVRGIESADGDRAYLSGWLRNADCKNITEGMDLKIVKAKAFDKTYVGYKKGVLVKLPTGMTTWVAR